MSGTTLCIEVRFRLCREDDLPALEWMGLFSRDRRVIEAAFAAQERGEALMLLAEAGGFPVGQVWIDLAERGSRHCPHLWAVRVFPALQGAGLGRRLLEEAERRIRPLGAREVELSVEPDNHAARRFYERLGYRPFGLPRQVAQAAPEARQSVQEFLRKKLGS